MAGNISQQPNGQWRARYRDAERKEHARHFARKQDAQRWLDEQTAALVTGTWVAPGAGRVLFRVYAEEWRASQLFRPSTGKAVETALVGRIYPVLGSRMLESVTPSEVQRMVKKLSETLAPSTVRVTYSYVATIFHDAVRNRLIARTPCDRIKLPEIVRTKLDPLTTDQVLALADAMPARYRALVILAAGTGMREGECLGLTVDRVKWLERRIVVDRQLAEPPDSFVPEFAPPKTRASVRVVPLPAFVADELAAHIEAYGTGPDGLLFATEAGTPVRRRAIERSWRVAVAESGVRARFHDLRHHYASVLIRSGADVKAVQSNLGHAGPMETLTTYAHLWPDSSDRTREALEAAYAPAQEAPKVIAHNRG